MATIDDILGNGGGGTPPPKGSAEWLEQNHSTPPASSPAKGTQEWAEQNSGANAPVTSSTSTTTAPNKEKPTQSTAKGQTAESGGLSYVDLFNKLNPYKPPTEEELAKEKKRQKRDQIFAAIGDGISALSNLFFTTQYAPNMYTGKDTMSEQTQIRYDRLKKERDANNIAYYNGLIKAMKADDDKADNERKWQRMLDLDKKNDDRYNEGIKHRNEREKIADDRYDDELARKKERDDVADDHWQKNFDEGKRRANQAHNRAIQAQKDNKDLRERQIAATGARAVRGKQLGFSDGDGNQVSIYENVWKGSMQQVYDVMLSDLAPEGEKERKSFERQMKKLDTQQEKEDYVKQNWHKSPKAAAIMLSLSKLDPATMTSTIEEDDEGDGLGWGNSSGENDNETDW